jgi:ribosomal protein L18e/L15
MPIQRRLPKFGFKNPFRVEFRVVNLEDLQRIAESNSLEEITPTLLEDLRVIKRGERVKILGNGELSRKLRVQSHAFSASAKQAIEAVGGTAETL